jgi:hypothetical protein
MGRPPYRGTPHRQTPASLNPRGHPFLPATYARVGGRGLIPWTPRYLTPYPKGHGEALDRLSPGQHCTHHMASNLPMDSLSLYRGGQALSIQNTAHPHARNYRFSSTPHHSLYEYPRLRPHCHHPARQRHSHHHKHIKVDTPTTHEHRY